MSKELLDRIEGLEKSNAFLLECKEEWFELAIRYKQRIDALTTTLSLIRPLAFADHSSVEVNMEKIRDILNRFDYDNIKI